MLLSIFSYVSGPSVCPPWRSVCSSLLPIFKLCYFVFLEWSHVSSIYIWNSNPCLRYHQQICFFHTVGSLFILMLFSLSVKKLFNLMRSHLFIFSFMSLALGDISVKILLHGVSEILMHMFSSWIFMVSWLVFKSFIHLEFIFVYSVNWWSGFIFLHVAVQISQYHLLKRLFLLHFMLLPTSTTI